MNQPIINANRLTLGYANTKVLKNFSTNIFAGEFIGIFGPNGAGKSTFLRAILGLLNPISGLLTVFNQIPQRGNSAIGYLPQSRGTLPTHQLTGYTLLAAALHANRYGLPHTTAVAKAHIHEILNLVEGEHLARRPFNELSGGERQRLLLAQSLLGKPKILLLDEPLNNLDPYYQEIIIALVQKVAEQLTMTVLLAAHDMNPLLGVMDRIMYMVDGNAKIGSLDEVVSNETLSQLYGSPMEVIHYQNRIFVVSQKWGISEHFHQHCGDL